MAETRICSATDKPFTITDEDLAFYKRIDVPPPTLSPVERRLRRLLYRNDRKLYRRKCDLCKKDIIATYESRAPFPVYCNACWWGDDWNADNYARDFNFNKPFFEQWNELNSAVPHIALWQIQNENCDYTHDSSYSKDCYMLFGGDYNRNCYYCWNITYSKDLCDCCGAMKGERIYEGTDCTESQFNYYSQLIRNSSSCYFCFDMINCHNCFGSSGLRNKSYYFYNEPLSPEEYKKRFAELKFTQDKVWEYIQESHKISLSIPRRFVIQKNCEDCVGSYLGHCKNAKETFDFEESRDIRYSVLGYQCKDLWDCEIIFYNGEVCYESQTLIKNCFMCFFCYFLRDVKESMYCNECYTSQKLFGCVGLRNKKFCILNKEYPVDEYNEMMERIKKHMKETGELGQFFPTKFAPFAYNESGAYDYVLPSLTKEEALAKGFRWKDEDPKEHKPQSYKVPVDIKDVPDSIVNEVLACGRCGKNFKITQQELVFYKQNNIPIPLACFDCRHRARLLRRGPRALYDRKCDKCGTDIRTMYAPGRPETVYCEKCYLETVY